DDPNRRKRDAEKKDEERERAALESNRKLGVGLEAVQHRGSMNLGGGSKGSPGVKVKRERDSLSPAPSDLSDALAQLHQTPRTVTYGGQKKKKKRVADSDDESESFINHIDNRLSSPPYQSTTSGLKLKLSSQKPRPDPSPTPSNSTAAVSVTVGASLDFSLPVQPQRPLVPNRPGVKKPPKPGPKRQNEVNEDFSNVKAPSQVAFPTFWSGVEPYLREIREDDLALLNFKADAPESYEVPPRGRHYTEVWDEEDGLPPGTTPRIFVPSMRHSHDRGPGGLAVPHFVPSAEMKDETLVDEQRGLGGLTERIVAAFIKDKKVAETNSAAENARREALRLGDVMEEEVRDVIKIDVVDMEERVKKELKMLNLLGEHEDFDPSKRDDDEITSSLRTCQRLLVKQSALNEARKSRLSDIAKHRLAYAEYSSALEGIEKAIEAGWTKRVKKYGIAPRKTNNSKAETSTRPPVPETLKRLLAVRKQWTETVGKCMRELPRGEVVGMPEQSIYEGIGEGE
ncbi:hypothetical protein TREMEDRAFT_13632, partial [Tremella mesenterica DSM 1558]|uniref:uncharacterized protein n=1 Tax=Tremella mesenterica (strain ATCC 24925 / CBS 8224 / DSM 1558 / NBRC 9311 / NRRL Y-6157 / RJB 2259-6 / UBC 559-6) TaxID=578456 RepID=UPI0003F490B6